MEIRLIILRIAFGLIFLLLIVRLGYLQLHQSGRYIMQADKNRVKIVEEDPVRGLILDRRGRILVENRPCYTIVGNTSHLNRDRTSLELLQSISGGNEISQWETVLEKAKGSLREVRLKRDVDFALIAAVEERRLSLTGIEIKVEAKRFYPVKTASHLLGYLGEITQTELSAYQDFKAGDIVGKQGIEKAYNNFLWGARGYHFEEVDAYGNPVRIIGGMKSVQPANGADIYLTIDLDLQLLAEQLLEGKSGAVVAVDPANGGVLAMASSPRYDPEVFAGVLESSDWKALIEDPDKPLLDRTMQGVYPPGSLLKMAVLAGGLEENLVDINTQVHCPGFKQLGRRTFKCWREGGHGKIKTLQALEQSCDVYFYELSLKMGINKMAEYIRKFGLGQITGIDIEGESSGLVPDSAYMNRRYGPGQWTRGHLLNIAIGQGEMLATPLQMAVYCAALANRGLIPQPHLLKGVLYHNPHFWEPYQPEFKKIEGVSPETFELLLQGMHLVVKGDRGTAHWLNDPKIDAAGKTGTAQNPHGEDHAWFIGFAPFDNPVIAVCVIVEHGEHGSSTAAPMVFEIIRKRLLDEDIQSAEKTAKPLG
ncbi:MAG: penicillin-binding protein 2 [FCB group bacterium]|nr:penicillin-binding protein 2 [FCB group bacterium]